MTCKLTKSLVPGTDKRFALFLFGQGISNLGDTFQFIAATSLLVKITGSGLSAAFGLICGPVLSILFSALAGHLSDEKSEKAMLVFIDLLRGIVTLLFISRRSILEIYALVVILSILDIFYNPPRRKFLAGILKAGGLMKANSILNGLGGVMFIIGPILAAAVVNTYGTDIAFYIKSVSFSISALSIAVIKYKTSRPRISGRLKKPERFTVYSLFEGIEYCMNTYTLRKIIFISTVICFAATAVNIAFYPFAFDVLKISNSVWGTMMSVFYGANLISMPISLMTGFKAGTYYKVIIPLSLAAISTVWFSYGTTVKLNCILLLQLAEGTILSYLSIVLVSHLQIASKKEVLGRVVGISDFINNIGRILGIVFTYTLLRVTRPNFVFLFCAAFISVYAVCILVSVKEDRLKAVNHSPS